MNRQILSLLCLVLLGEICKADDNKKINACPNYTITEPITDPFALQEHKRQTIKEVWAGSIFENKTQLLTKMIFQIEEFSNYESFLATQMILEFTSWAVGLLKITERFYPSFCPFAKAINQTLDWKASGNSSKYVDAIDTSLEAGNIAGSGTRYAMLKDMGCPNISEPEISKAMCWKYGFSFNTEELWQSYGRSVSWPLKDTIDELFKSNLFIEKATATLFYFILLPQIHFAWNSTPMEYSLEYFKMISQSGNGSIGKCCCDAWTSRMNVLDDLIMNPVYTAIAKKTEELKNDCNN